METAVAPRMANGVIEASGLVSPGVAQVDRVKEEEWNDCLEDFVDASLYQTWAYGAESWGDSALSHLILRHRDTPVALAQLYVARVPIVGSGVAYLRWGPLCLRKDRPWNPDVLREMTAALVDEYAVRRGLVLRVIPNAFVQDPTADAAKAVLAECGLREDRAARQYHTMRVDLRASGAELRQRLSSRWRRQLSIAERNTLEILEGPSDELYEEFRRLYRQMFARKRFETTVDVEEFGRIQHRLPASQKLMVFICKSEGRSVAGLVVSVVGRTGLYLLAATGDEGLNARGSYLLQWHAIQRLKERDCHWYDLGGVNAEANPGVFTFKSGMGGEEARQIGRHEISRRLLSDLSLAAAEGARDMLRRAAHRAAQWRGVAGEA